MTEAPPAVERTIPADRVRPRRAGRVVAALAWLYLLVVLLLWVVVETSSDRWWPATIALFGPRWVWGLPLAALSPAAARLRPRALWVLLNAAVVVAGPLMGFCVPWRAPGAPPGAGGRTIRLLTCNAGGHSSGNARLEALIDAVGPDVVAVQEGTAGALLAGPREAGWDVRGRLASHLPIRATGHLDPDGPDGDGFVDRFDLEAPFGPIHVVNLHLETPREGLEAMIDRGWDGLPAMRANTLLRAEASDRASRWIGQLSGPVLVAGDFNMPVESEIYRRAWSRFSNAFSEAGLGYGYTKSTRWFGVRIDHVLAGPGWRCRACWVGPDVGSDHRPLIAELQWLGAED